MSKVILHTCGISALLGIVRKAEKHNEIQSIINSCTNSKEITDPGNKERIQSYLGELDHAFQSNPDMSELAKLSAEFNGMLAIYEHDLTKAVGDKHYLLYTDTFLGKEVATLLERHMQRMRITNVELKCMDHVNMASSDDFRRGVSMLIGWIGEQYSQWKNEGYEVIFHLTGGFKMLHGYLQVAGLFFADKMVCLFERSDALIEVPKMEISLEKVVYDKVRNHLNFFRQFEIKKCWCINNNKESQDHDMDDGVNHGLLLPDDLNQDITFSTDGGIVELTPWGSICWQKAKERIYQEEDLLLSPSPLLSFSDEFERSFQEICKTPAMRKAVNRFVDKFVKYLRDPYKPDDNTIPIILRPHRSNKSPETYEIDVNLDGKIYRILLHDEQEELSSGKKRRKTVFDAIIS